MSSHLLVVVCWLFIRHVSELAKSGKRVSNNHHTNTLQYINVHRCICVIRVWQLKCLIN